ncbi:hypothetical protein ACIQ9Q_42040 [Streptomyces sp. NPDC094438]|uniref:hypothetical protein n=1 Tax=Streptomyces sp. NPDC094438 TaxID=3366061 RepID=UPI0037F50979
MRGSRSHTRQAIVLLAAMEHGSTVLAQRQIACKGNEIPAFAPSWTPSASTKTP